MSWRLQRRLEKTENMSHGKREFIQACISTKQMGADPEGLWPVVLTFSDRRKKKVMEEKQCKVCHFVVKKHICTYTLGLSNDDFFKNCD